MLPVLPIKEMVKTSTTVFLSRKAVLQLKVIRGLSRLRRIALSLEIKTVVLSLKLLRGKPVNGKWEPLRYGWIALVGKTYVFVSGQYPERLNKFMREVVHYKTRKVLNFYVSTWRTEGGSLFPSV